MMMNGTWIIGMMLVFAISQVIATPTGAEDEAARVKGAEDEAARVKEDISELKIKKEQLSKQLTETEEALLLQKVKDAPRPATAIGAFYASLSRDTVVLADSVIVFDTAHHIPDGDYNNNTGYYTCPLDGTYVFHVTITSSGGDQSKKLMKDGIEVMRFATGYPSARHTGVGLAVMHCTMGEAVYVTPFRNPTIYGGGLSHFSGYLLHADPLKVNQHSGCKNSHSCDMQDDSKSTTVGAFYVYAYNGPTVSAGSRLVFDYIGYNPHGNYATNGIYTCPLNGTYMFYVNACKYSSSSAMTVALRKSNVQQMVIHTGPSGYATGGGMAIIHCTAGNTVDVIALTSGTMTGPGHTHFSGHLLHQVPV